LRSLDDISGDVLDVSIRLHQALGPGMMESVYETVLAGKLTQLGYKVERQKPVPVVFEGHHFDNAFRIDLLIEECLLVEIKCAERLSAAHFKQILTYLRLTNQHLGLLINFGGATLKEGFRRVVNDYEPSASLRSLREQ
jgi:iron complex transport system substrate-binding protein